MLFQRYDISAGVQVASGSVITEITRVVQDKHSNLLVCGARGQSVARRLLLGSTVQKMLNHMPCPLLVVKPALVMPTAPCWFPSIFTCFAAHDRTGQAIAPQAEIILLHVYEAPFEASVRFAHIDHDTLTHYRNVIRKDAQGSRR
jgi:hypothetical protein